LSGWLADVAVGCLDVRAPSDAWMRRVDSDKVEIGCYMSRQIWVLRCVDNQFVGVIGNCSQRTHSRGGTRFSELGGPGRMVVDLPPAAATFTSLPFIGPKSSDLCNSHGWSCWRIEGESGPLDPLAHRRPWRTPRSTCFLSFANSISSI